MSVPWSCRPENGAAALFGDSRGSLRGMAVEQAVRKRRQRIRQRA